MKTSIFRTVTNHRLVGPRGYPPWTAARAPSGSVAPRPCVASGPWTWPGFSGDRVIPELKGEVSYGFNVVQYGFDMVS